MPTNNNSSNIRLNNKWSSYADRHDGSHLNNNRAQFIGDQATSEALGNVFAGKVFADPETAARERAMLREKHLIRFTSDPQSGLEYASCEVCSIRLTPLDVDQQWICTQCGKRTPFDIESLLNDERLKAGNPLKLKVAGKQAAVLKQKGNDDYDDDVGGREHMTGERLPKGLRDKISKRFYNKDDDELREQGFTVVNSETIDPT